MTHSTKPRPLLALNWKMNKTPSQAGAWAKELQEELPPSEIELAVLAPAIDLPIVAAELYGTPVATGGQDVSRFGEGAYTGEISASMLAGAGARYVIVGHSERRAMHGETDEVVSAKARAALQGGLIPIVCVGEPLAVRERGGQTDFALDQWRASLAGVLPDSPDRLVIAYEPVWAIGTGRTATAQDAEDMARALRGALRGLFMEYGQSARILYGGSVKPGNVAEICAGPNVNGALVGGASLDLSDVLGMVRALG